VSSWDPGRVSRRSRLEAALRLIRIEHTLFSLPFAYVGMVLSGYPYTAKTVALATLAVFGLRSAGMAFNNIADLEIDRRNPRTAGRPLVVGALSLRDAWVIVLAGSLLYFLSAFLLNAYAFALSPLLYAVAMSYPYAKRLHPFPHIHLGLSLGLVVFGGAIAASGGWVRSLFEALRSVPWLYLGGVTFWVAGFDTLYSIMDVEYDRKEKLGSIPSRFGVGGALAFSSAFYSLAFALFMAAVYAYKLGAASLISAAASGAIMAVQEAMAARSLKNIPKAFNMNLALGILVSAGVLIDAALKVLL